MNQPSQPPQQPHGFFSSSKPQGPPAVAPPPQFNMSDLVRRLKIVEETLDNEQNMLEHHKKQNKSITVFADEIDEMKREISSMKDDIKLIIEELRMTAKAEEVKILQKYLDMWNPVKFVTAREVQRIIKDEIRNLPKNTVEDTPESPKIADINAKE